MAEGKNVRSRLMNQVRVGIEPSARNQSSGRARKSESREVRYDVNDVYVSGLETFSNNQPVAFKKVICLVSGQPEAGSIG